MRKEHVLLIGPFPPPIGGDTVFTLNLSKSELWKKHGVELRFIDTSPRGGVRLPDERLSVEDLIRGIRIFFEACVKLPRCGAVLLWANGRFILTVGLGIMVCARLWRKSVFVKPFGGFLARRIMRAFPPWRRLSIGVLRNAACLLPETRALEQELVDEVGFQRERVLFLPNFLPESSFVGSPAPKRFSGATVFFGQIKREKGVFDIVEALRGQGEFRCDFFGPIVDRDRDAFMEALSCGGTCAYRGQVKPDSVMETIGGYDVLLLPSYHPGEGYPAVILQAFAAGVPVIASDWKDIPEIVDDGVTGILVPPKAPARIREALRRLAADGALYESMAANAFAFSRGFSEKAVVDGILVARVSGLLS